MMLPFRTTIMVPIKFRYLECYFLLVINSKIFAVPLFPKIILTCIVKMIIAHPEFAKNPDLYSLEIRRFKKKEIKKDELNIILI